VRLTTLGHAGLLIEAGGRRIVCDPWFSPAYLEAWLPFPRNDNLDRGAWARPDYLYVSHLHKDHFDAELLAEMADPAITVVLPDYPLDLLERAMRALGYSRFLRTSNSQPLDLGDLTLTVVALGAPTDGPIGDSALVVEDESGRICNLNDARPTDLNPFLRSGRPDVLFLQTSGAIWYPMVYDFPAEKMALLGAAKRRAGMERAMRIVELLDPAVTVPFAGPPCFLDAELFHLNDFDNSDTNTFPDQTVFLDYLSERRGERAGRLMVPGSVAELAAGCDLSVSHQSSEEELAEMFADKAGYLARYRQDWAGRLDAARSSWGHPELDLAESLANWVEPLMEIGERLCADIGGAVLICFGDAEVIFDFRLRQVRPWKGEEWDHRFNFSKEIGEHLVFDHVEDWVNDAFLSCRFTASRRVPHNDAVFTFFKCLSAERMAYAESWLAELEANEETIELGGWRLPRRCPHGRADLSRFGVVCGAELTCHLHGYRYDLETGACLTNPRLSIAAERSPT
jgi:UDP-MurNAc hydroxylase